MTADLRGSGRQDIVEAAGDNGIAVFLNNGDGTFSAPTYFPTGTKNRNLAIGDFNGDRRPDVVVSVVGQATLKVLLGNGDGTFKAPITSPLPVGCDTAGPLATGDFNHGGTSGVAAGAGCDLTGNGTGYCCGALTVLLSNGDGTLAPSTGGHACRPATGPSACYDIGGIYHSAGAITVADLRKNGTLDLVTAELSGFCGVFIAVQLGTGNGAFSDATQYPVACAGGAVSVGDVTGDGIADLVTTGSPSFNACFYGNDCADLVVLRGTGSGTFAAPVFTATDHVRPKPTALADFNGDGPLDIAAPECCSNGTILQVWGGNGDGTFGSSSSYPFTGGLSPTVLAADLNGDGSPDVVVGTSGGFAVFMNTTASLPPGGGLLQKPPLGGNPTARQNLARGNPCWGCGTSPTSRTWKPVNTNSGNFWHSFSGMSIAGRGAPLDFTYTYNSLSAAADSPLGFGWTFGTAMSLTQDAGGGVTVHQENGSEVSFTASPSGYAAPPRVIAQLVKQSDGSFTFTRQAKQHFTFSPSGRLTSEADLNGYRTTLGYTGSQLTRITDEAGRSLNLTYKGARLTKVTDPIGRTLLFAYDAQGNLSDATDVNAGTTRFTYDSAHRLATMHDPMGGVVTNHYDSSGRIDWQTDELGRKTAFSYTGDNFSNTGGSTTITDPAGHVEYEVYQYGLRTALTRGYGTPQAATWQFRYDPATLAPTLVIDPNSHRVTTTYDGQANALMSTDALGRKRENSYNSFNEVVTSKDPAGVTATYAYDARGNLINASTPLSGTAAVQATVFKHDDPAHPGDATSMIDPDQKVWTFGYDTYGNRTSVTDPLANTARSSYTPTGWLVSSTTPGGKTWTYDHDVFGKVTKTTDPLRHSALLNYDKNQNTIASVDPNHNVTRFVYDSANELTQVQRADGTVTATDYKLDGTVSTQRDGTGNPILRYEYDSRGQVTASLDALNNRTSFLYDTAGNLIARQDPGGNCASAPVSGCTSLTYNEVNQPLSVTYSDGATPNVTGIQYDTVGRRKAQTDGTGAWSWSWDSLGRLKSVSEGSNGAISYDYNLRGAVTQITYPGAHAVTHTYDDAGRWTNVSDWLGHEFSFGYDVDSNLIKQAFPGGVVDTFGFDAANRLMSATALKSGNPDPLFAATYTRDSLNQLSSDSSMPSEKRGYGYTKLNQLCYAGGEIGADCGDGSQPFAYDHADNLVTLGDNTQQFNSANQLCWTVTGQSANACQIAPPEATTFAYDLRGNRRQTTPPQGDAMCYTYDQENRLALAGTGQATVCGSPTASTTYKYSGDGLRMTKGGAAAASFVWDLAASLPLAISDGTASFVFGPGGLPVEQVAADNSVLLFHHDQIGSTRLLTDSAGAVNATYAYDPYGALVRARSDDNEPGSGGRRIAGKQESDQNRTAIVSTPLLYTGQYLDTESGLYYLRARHYDPTTAQFLSRDPLTTQTRSAHAYVNGNPINRTDPSGLWYNPGLVCDPVAYGPMDPTGFRVCGPLGQIVEITRGIAQDITVPNGATLSYNGCALVQVGFGEREFGVSGAAPPVTDLPNVAFQPAPTPVVAFQPPPTPPCPAGLHLGTYHFFFIELFGCVSETNDAEHNPHEGG